MGNAAGRIKGQKASLLALFHLHFEWGLFHFLLMLVMIANDNSKTKKQLPIYGRRTRKRSAIS
jgi:hypothetical protein